MRNAVGVQVQHAADDAVHQAARAILGERAVRLHLKEETQVTHTNTRPQQQHKRPHEELPPSVNND